MKRVEESLLYTFIDTAYLRGRDPAEVARELCAGGSDLIQLRAKELALDEVRRMAERVAPIIRSAELLFVINDHVRVAMEVGAQFCHLGQEDFFDGGYVDVNQLTGTGSGLKIGLSSHAPDQATRAVSAGAAYVAVGPVFATPTKPGARAVTVDYVRWAAQNVAIPWFAIGGINLTNLEAVLEAGARRVCVVSAILNAPSIAKACQSFKERLISAGRT